MIKKGTVVYFKKARLSSRGKMGELAFKGYGFGVMLGIVPPFSPDPPQSHLLRLLGTCGFMSFDDVLEFLGPEVQAEVLKKYEEKYWPKQSKERQEAEESIRRASSIVGIDGKPLPLTPDNIQ